MFFSVSLSKIIIFANILLLLSVSTVKAAEEIEDYSKGFAVFYKFGLPDVSKAEYVNFYNKTLNNWNPVTFTYWNLSGNGWLIKKNDDGPALFVFSNAIAINVYDGKKPEFADLWNEVDLELDIQILLSELEGMDRESFSYRQEFIGPAFLYAIQIHSKGFKKEANEIISRLFELSGEKKLVLLAALNSLADQQYLQNLLDLQESRDWEKFGASLDALLKKYPKGWQSAPGIKLLLEMTKKQIANPVPPEIKGEEISEEDKKLAAALVNVTELPCRYDMELIIPGYNDEKYEERDSFEKDRDTIPMLIALLKDDYMLCISKKKDNSQGTGNNKNSEPPELCLSKIPHPFKRKDIAKALLLPVLICGNLNISTMDDDAFAEVCRRWYDEIKTKTDDELMLYYLKNGNDSQKKTVVIAMMDGDVAKNAPAIEEFLLNMKKEKLQDILHLLAKYVAKRKKAAAPFVEQLRAKFKDELEEAGKNHENETVDAEKEDSVPPRLQAIRDGKRYLNELSRLSSGKSARQIVNEILSGKKKLSDRTISYELMPALEDIDKDEALGELLYGALKTDNLCLKSRFIEECTKKFIASENKNKKGQASKPFMIEKNAEAWEKLLADKAEYNPIYRFSTSIYMTAAIAIEEIYGGETKIFEMYDTRNLIGKRVEHIILERAVERLAGKKEDELTPYPKFKNMDKETAGKLAGNLDKAIEDKQVAKFINALDDREFAAISILIARNPKLNAGLENYANRIVSIKCSLKGEEKKLDNFRDTGLDKAGVEEIQEYCKKLASEKKCFICTITRKPAFGGISISITDDEEEFQKITIGTVGGKKYKVVTPSYMSGSIQKISCSAYTRWDIPPEEEEKSEIVINGEKIKLENTGQNVITVKRKEDSRKRFIQSLEKVFDNQQNCSHSFFIIYELK